MKRTMILFAFAALALCACSDSDKELNITILLDLSDRIDTVNQDKKDIEAIKIIAKQFKDYYTPPANMFYDAKGKIQVKAEPHDDTIDSLLESMRIDLKPINNDSTRIAKLDKMASTYTDGLNAIYQHAIETGRILKKRDGDWPGSDIWGFFKDKVGDVCIDTAPIYRNILIILTDGYIYHVKTKEYEDPMKPKRFAYLLSGKKLNNLKYYDNPNWENKINDDDFGLITKRNDLQNLEILVLGIRTTGGLYTEEILTHVIGKWFDEMGVSKNKKKIVGADAVDIKTIEKFLQ